MNKLWNIFINGTSGLFKLIFTIGLIFFIIVCIVYGGWIFLLLLLLIFLLGI